MIFISYLKQHHKLFIPELCIQSDLHMQTDMCDYFLHQ